MFRGVAAHFHSVIDEECGGAAAFARRTATVGPRQGTDDERPLPSRFESDMLLATPAGRKDGGPPD